MSSPPPPVHTSDPSLLAEVQAAVAEAIQLSCGYDITQSHTHSLKHCHVQRSSNFRNSGDLKTNAAAGIFLMHTAAMRKKRLSSSTVLVSHSVTGAGTGTSTGTDAVSECGREGVAEVAEVMEVVTTSPYGLQRPRRYEDVRALAESIILHIPEEAMESIIAHAFVQLGPKNSCHIVITTKQHLSWQLGLDKLHCVTCGKFFKGSRGLRTHQIIDHKFATEDARQDALDSELQVIVYVPPIISHSTASGAPPSIPSSIDDLGDAGLNFVRRGDLQSIKDLMTDGQWDPHTAMDKHGNTCLTWAAGEGHLDMCRFFVEECGMNALVKTGARKRQRQALHWAARNGHIDICAWLIGEHHAEVDAGTDDGSTPLHLAIWNHQPDTVKWLIEESRSNVNKKNGHGCNASQWAALSGDINMLVYLKEKGLDLTILNANGRSAVHKAGLKGHLAACKWLLTSTEHGGAGLSLLHVGPDIEGDTPASLAKSNGHSKVEQWLNREQERLRVLSGGV